MKGSKSVSDPIKEEEIKVQYVKPIGGNTLPPEYSKEISRYQPSEKERIRAMKDALSAVRQFTSEGNLGRNGNLNTNTMKEMWDYESREPFSGKIEKTPEKSRGSQVKSSNECELCGGNHKVEQCPHERKFSLGTDTTSSDSKDTPQPTCALQEFVKHIADPLVNKGWNLHLKFGKGESQGEKFVNGSSPWEPTAKTDRKEKVSKPQIGRQISLEMGTGGGGGGGKKGGNGSKRHPEDKIDIEDHPSEGDEDDSSSETSLELDLDPQQLASV